MKGKVYMSTCVQIVSKPCRQKQRKHGRSSILTTETTVTRNGEFKKNKYVWRGVMERQHARQKGEQTDEDIKSA